MYVSTGNGGPFNRESGTYTNSVVKLTPDLHVVDWFEPSDNELLNERDADLGSNRPIQILGTNLIVIAGKDYNICVLDKTCLGHLQGTGRCKSQIFKSDPTGHVSLSSGSFGGTFMNNVLYLPLTRGPIRAFELKGKTFTPQPIAASTATYGPWGAAQMSGSSNKSNAGLLWVTTAAVSAFGSRQAGTLRALDARTLVELWNSGGQEKDALGDLAKFASPTIADGRVFIADVTGKVNVYGLGTPGKIGVAAR